MIAIIYLAAVFVIGDQLASRFLTFVSAPHRVAVGFLTGLLVSTWFTYLAAFSLSKTSNPLLWGNVVFFLGALSLLIYWRTPIPSVDNVRTLFSDLKRNEKWDLIFIGIFLVVAVWMMFGTFGYSDGRARIANHQWSDFGSTVSIMQSFAEGSNFPTEYPHFSGDRIRYHFLFYFQAGNLEYLGLNPALAANALSVLSLVSLLVLVMALGRVLFNSRVVGRIGAALFFFHGSLAFIPFLISTGSFSNLVTKLSVMRDFVPSGFPYRGEDWGVWTQVVYLNQRHLASSIGILLIVLIFLTVKYKSRLVGTGIDSSNDGEVKDNEVAIVADYGTISGSNVFGKDSIPFIFLGVLLGLLPLWNGALFASAAVVLALAFLLVPFYRKEMIALAVASAIVALPQVIFLKGGVARPAGYSLFHWGYILNDPTPFNVIYYLLFTFGFKWLLIGVTLYFASSLQRRFMIAISGLIALAFCFQFSDEVLTNHKFLNVWLIIANLFAASGLVLLWDLKNIRAAVAARALAVIAAAAILVGGVLDIFPIKNSYWVEIKLNNDHLVDWVRANTAPSSIFLSYRYVNHGILMAGRKLFYGHPYYAWGAGHDTGGRDAFYKKMFESKDAGEVHRLLTENGIDYVAIDNGVRRDGFIKDLNESVFDTYFPKVFSDLENRYDNLSIYIVPAAIGAPVQPTAPVPNAPDNEPAKAAVSPFDGGEGNAPGQFAKPRGIAADEKGNFYVADSGNARIQKFDSAGKHVLSFGKSGDGEGELKEPNGIAIDQSGEVFVADAVRGALIRFAADGKFLKEWKGPDTKFYGPRDLAFGPNKQLYILDQGNARVLRFDPATEAFAEWGSGGEGEGQFKEPTGLTVGNGFVFVADAGNNRLQVFDLEGKFVRQWEIPAWDRFLWHYPDAVFDGQTKRLYVTSGWSNEVLAFDVEGNLAQGFKPEGDGKLENPSSLAILESKKSRRLIVLNTGGMRASAFELEPQKTK